MGVLGGVMAANAPAAWDDYWYTDRGAVSASGMHVTPEAALTLSHIYAGTAYIAEDIAKIPLNVFEILEDGGKQPVSASRARGSEIERAQALHHRLHSRPNRYQDALEWREMMTAFAVLRGRGVSEIRRGARPGYDDEYVPLHPDLVHEETLRSGTRRYRYRDPLQQGEERILLDDEVFVLRGRLGKGVLDYAKESIALSLMQERNTSNLFSRGARHQGVITHPKILPDKARENLRKALDEYQVNGPRSGRPLLLEDGMTWMNGSISPKDAEQLDSRRWSVTEGCRWFRIPPHKLFELERSTNNNIETQKVEYVIDSLLGWGERWEQAILRDLIANALRFFAEHNLDGLLRGDFETRMKGYALAIQWGIMTRNEVRSKENLNPISGGDALERPLNMEQIGGGARAQLDDGQSTILRGRLRLHASDAAARVVRRELGAMSKLAERSAGDEAAWRAGVEAFYAEHGEHVAAALHIPEHEAARYARRQRDQLLAEGVVATDDWLVDRVGELAGMVTDGMQEIAA